MTETTISVTTPASATKPATPSGPGFFWGTGRRKTSVARVRLRPGTGQMLVNGRPLESFFPVDQHRVDVLAPLRAAAAEARFDVFANIEGGGITGQAGAMRLGIARALVKADAGLEEPLRDGGYLTRDSRMVERKKYGQRKARRRFQFSKR